MVNKKNKAILLDKNQIQKSLIRLAHEIIEKNSNLDNVSIIGIRTRGDIIAQRLHSIIKDIVNCDLDVGTLDVTFYRDDFETNLGTPKIGPSNILFDVKNTILIPINSIKHKNNEIYLDWTLGRYYSLYKKYKNILK